MLWKRANLASLFSLTGLLRRRTHDICRRSGYRPRIDVLEDRCLLSTMFWTEATTALVRIPFINKGFVTARAPTNTLTPVAGSLVFAGGGTSLGGTFYATNNSTIEFRSNFPAYVWSDGTKLTAEQ